MSPARSPHPPAPRAARVGASRLRRRRAALLLGTLLAGVPVYLLSAPPRAEGGRTSTTTYAWSLPQGFPKPRVPKTNEMTAAKVELGRRLFYDARLSGNGTQSCSSCHLQERAFTDGLATPVGSTGERLNRNSQSLVNVAYHTTLTWGNPGLVSLERQMEVPLFAHRPVELGINDRNKPRVLRRIARDRWYARRFAAAFPGRKQPVSWTTIVHSLASFQRSIISARSKYDRVRAGKAKLTASERRGADLFLGEGAECHHCHGSFIFNDQITYDGAPIEQPKFHNTGQYNLDGQGAYPEGNRGLFELTADPADMGKFKAPSLRNVELTAPYLHDGSAATLEEVVANYAAGGRVITGGPRAGDGRANPHKDPEISRIALSAQDQADIVAFLKTLTDRAVTRDPRFADPFASKRR